VVAAEQHFDAEKAEEEHCSRLLFALGDDFFACDANSNFIHYALR